MPLCSTVCSWNCVYVHLYKQGICKGARACGEKAGVPEASQTAADREGADRLPGVDLQSRSVSQVNKIFINTWHVISPQNHQRCSCVFLAPENDLHCNHQKASVCSLQSVLSPRAFSPMTVSLTRFPDLFSVAMGADVFVPVCCTALPLSMATTQPSTHSTNWFIPSVFPCLPVTGRSVLVLSVAVDLHWSGASLVIVFSSFSQDFSSVLNILHVLILTLM